MLPLFTVCFICKSFFPLQKEPVPSFPFPINLIGNLSRAMDGSKQYTLENLCAKEIQGVAK